MSASVLKILSGPLEATESLGLETTDPRFTEITDLVGAENYVAVAERVEDLVEGGIYDIRLITKYMYSVFDAEGLAQADEIFECLLSLLGTSFQNLGPARRREQHVAKSVTWLCETMTDRIAYHASKKDERWQSWKGVEPVRFEKAKLALDQIADRLEAPCFADSSQVVGHLSRWFREIHAEVEPPVASSVAEGSEQAELATAHCKQDQLTSAQSQMRPIASPVSEVVATSSLRAGTLEPITLEGSFPLQALLQKLAAFERLILAGKFDRAALICDDLHALMDNFDPREYFPQLFSNFSRLLTENIAELEVQWQHRDGTMWNAMRQFSRVDLQGFVDSTRMCDDS